MSWPVPITETARLALHSNRDGSTCQHHLLPDPQPCLHLKTIVHEADIFANQLVILLINPLVCEADVCVNLAAILLINPLIHEADVNANRSATLLTRKSRLF
jgi:hypothetical protein